jgi:hypothetical protein
VTLRLGLATVLVLSACGALEGERGSGVLAGPRATPSAAPTTGRPSGSAAPGYVRVTDDRGGWSLDRPAGWFEKAARLTWPGREIRSYDPRGMDASGNIPRAGDVLVRVQLRTNPEGLDLEAFADGKVWTATCRQCRRIVERAALTLGGEPAVFFSVHQEQPPGFAELEPNLYWLVRSPFFADRVVVVQARPAASPHRAEVERMVATLQFFQPAPPELVPTRTRQQVIDLIRSPGRTITRIEAKLMLWSEWEEPFNEWMRAKSALTGGPSGISSPIDPDTLVWVVAYAGSGFTPMKGGPSGAGGTAAATPREWDWGLSVLPARDPFDWGGPTTGGTGAWPAWFDTLADRGT